MSSANQVSNAVGTHPIFKAMQPIETSSVERTICNNGNAACLIYDFIVGLIPILSEGINGKYKYNRKKHS